MALESTAVVTAIYATFSTVRILFYVPQLLAVSRERSPAHAISIISWTFWSISHAATAVYGLIVTHDTLLSAMMWSNAAGCSAIVALTIMKRRRYGWSRA